MGKNGSSLRSLGRMWEDMILPGWENPRNCMDQDEMKMRWCLSTPRSPDHVLPVAQSSSVTPVSPYTHHRSLTMYLEAVIQRDKRCPWRPRSSEPRDALGWQHWVSSVIHSEAVIESVWRCTWRLRSIELRNALGSRERVSLEMRWEDVIEWGWRCNLRPRLSELRDALGGRDWARLEMHLLAMIGRDWRSTWKRSLWREARQQLWLYSLVNL